MKKLSDLLNSDSESDLDDTPMKMATAVLNNDNLKKLSGLLNSDSESDFDETPTKMATAVLNNDNVKFSKSATDAVTKSIGKRKRRIIDSDSDSDGDAPFTAAATASACATSIETNDVTDVCETVSTPLLAPFQSTSMICEPIPSSTTATVTTPLKHVKTGNLVLEVPVMKQLRERSTMCLGDLLGRSPYKRSPLNTELTYFEEDTIIFPAEMQTDSTEPSSPSHATLSTAPSSSTYSGTIPGPADDIAGNDSIEAGNIVAKSIVISTRIEPEYDEWMEETNITPARKSTEVTASTVKKKRVRNTAKKKKLEEIEMALEEEIDDPLQATISPGHSTLPIIAAPPAVAAPAVTVAAPAVTVAAPAVTITAPVAAIITMLVPPLPRIEITMPDDLICSPLPKAAESTSKKRILPKSLEKGRTSDTNISKYNVPPTSTEMRSIDTVKTGSEVQDPSCIEDMMSKSGASGYSFQETQESNDSDDSLDVIRAALNLNSPELDDKSSRGEVKSRKLRRLSSTCPHGRLRALGVISRQFYYYGVFWYTFYDLTTLNSYPMPTEQL